MEHRHVAILGNGSWATALAKIVMQNQQAINWYIRRDEVIEKFSVTGKNPDYLTNVAFDPKRIQFSSDINEVINASDVLILAIPSPYVKASLQAIYVSLADKTIITATKGMIPDENQIVSDYLHERFHMPYEKLAVVTGPCHAEEIALDRLSYLTIGCEDGEYAKELAKLFETSFVHTTYSTDIVGLEYSSVLKNIFAIASGMCQSLRYGDNFQAVLISNAVQEIRRFLAAANDKERDIDASGYLGDVLVTCYSKFSRNRQFGQMMGMGYSVKAAQLEMQMIAEGYYGTNCIHIANERLQVNLPIVEAMYRVLYKRESPTLVIQELTTKLQ
ncbi:MAG: NAD(P)H-dependent glycerol-3-phosphate dehydrogenase [Paludibacteraceae bacterium]|nr:NAD(P)H-dependent glycerol-3-phosphate dehydrogenase [Paludibacteraceae bacterium]